MPSSTRTQVSYTKRFYMSGGKRRDNPMMVLLWYWCDLAYWRGRVEADEARRTEVQRGNQRDQS